MTTPMSGPVLDANPPTGDKWDTTNIKWKFKNDTGEPIRDLRMVVHGKWYSILPDITKVSVKDAGGTSVGSKDFNHVHDAHLDLTTPIAPGEELSVTITFDSSFDLGESIQFSPTGEDGVHLVADVAPVPSDYLAYVTTVTPPVARDVLMLGGVLPLPWTTPLTVTNIVRWLMRVLAGTAAADHLPDHGDLASIVAAVLRESDERLLTTSQVKQKLRPIFFGQG